MRKQLASSTVHSAHLHVLRRFPFLHFPFLNFSFFHIFCVFCFFLFLNVVIFAKKKFFISSAGPPSAGPPSAGPPRIWRFVPCPVANFVLSSLSGVFFGPVLCCVSVLCVVCDDMMMIAFSERVSVHTHKWTTVPQQVQAPTRKSPTRALRYRWSFLAGWSAPSRRAKEKRINATFCETVKDLYSELNWQAATQQSGITSIRAHGVKMRGEEAGTKTTPAVAALTQPALPVTKKHRALSAGPG